MKVAFNYKQTNRWEPENISYISQVPSRMISHGELTIIDQNSILEKLKLCEKMSSSCISINLSHQQLKRNDGIKEKIRLQKQLKLVKIMAVKQRRSEFKDITEIVSSSSEYKHINPIQIVSRVYDDVPNDFERMCKYYALINNDNNSNQISNKNINYQMVNPSSHKKSNQLGSLLGKQSQYGKNILLKKEEYGNCEQFQNHYSQTDSSFSPNQAVKQHFSIQTARENFQSRSKNYEEKNQTSSDSCAKVISINSQANYMEANNLNKLHKNDNKNIQFSTGYQSLCNRESIKLNYQSKKSKKEQQQERKVLYDSSFSDSFCEKLGNRCEKHRKVQILNDPAQEQFIGRKIKQSQDGSQNTQQIILQDLNQGRIKQDSCRKCNQNLNLVTKNYKQGSNGSNTKEEFQIFPVSMNMVNQQKLSNLIEDLETLSQEGVDRQKQDRFYQQLQLLVTSQQAGLHQNSIEDSLSILQKCIYLTQASHAHSIMSNLLNDFSNISSISSSLISDAQNLTEEDEEEDEAAGTLSKQKIGSSQRMCCRTNTSYSRNSRSSVTTQLPFSKPSSTPSISNILETSHCQESTKAEMSDIANNNNDIDTNCDINSSNKKQEETKISQCQQQIEQQQQQQLINKILSEKKETEDFMHCEEKNEEKEQNSLKDDSSKFENLYVSQCKNFFRLNNLTQQQLHQFQFSQYKKKNFTAAAPSNSAGCSPKNALNQQVNQSIDVNSNNKHGNPNVSKFGKYHNYNKLFMYNILNMFQPNNLANMNVPEAISKELQMLISRIKTSAKNNYKVEGKYAFDYFSHAHYNVLFLQLSPENIEALNQQEEYVSLYKSCFNIDLTENISSMTLTYINLIKVYCYQIFIQCIREENIKVDNSLTQENLKNQYTLKVIRGIKKLSQGIIIKRF